jgi:hypothetical protein
MPAQLKAHLHREVPMAVWRELLNEGFVDAYVNGMIVRCLADGMLRRLFLRILTYSMDYPEKSVHFHHAHGSDLTSIQDAHAQSA